MLYRGRKATRGFKISANINGYVILVSKQKDNQSINKTSIPAIRTLTTKSRVASCVSKISAHLRVAHKNKQG